MAVVKQFHSLIVFFSLSLSLPPLFLFKERHCKRETEAETGLPTHAGLFALCFGAAKTSPNRAFKELRLLVCHCDTIWG